MANLVLKNNSSTTSTELTMEVKDKSTWKLINNNGTFIINSTNDLVTIDNTGKVNINKGHLYLNGAAGTSTGNTTQIVFRQNSNGTITEHIAISSNDDAFVINPTSSSTTNQIVLYLGADRTSLLPSSLKIDKNLTVTGTSTLTGTVYIKSGASAIATLAGPTTAGTFTFPNTGGTFVTHPTRGTAVGSDARPVYIASNGSATVVSGINAANYFLNSLSTGSSTPVDNDYYISQYVGGGTTTTTYHRRPMSALWTYIKDKMNTDGNAASATKLKTPRTLTVGNTGKTFDGTANVSWSANEIGCLSLVQRGSEFADAADLNTIGYGNYFSNNSTKSATLSNGPTKNAGFRLFHQRGYNGTAGIYDWQFAFTSNRAIYQRYRNGDGNWGDWGTFIIKNDSDAVGNATTPIYVNANGATVACSTYAGGTAVTLNGTSKAASTASFYAPTSAGTSGYILKSNGSGAPSWLQTLPVAHGGTGHTSWTKNRLVWTSETNELTGGNHWADADHIGINMTTAPSTALGVGGAIEASNYIRANNANLSAYYSTETSAQVYALNPNGSIGLLVSAGGNRGLYDRTRDAWLIYYNVENARQQQAATYFTGGPYITNSTYIPSMHFQSSSAADDLPLGSIRYLMQNSSSDTNYTYSAMYFYQFSYVASSRKRKNNSEGAGIYERFKLPTTAAGLTESATYSILTTKNTLTVAQGGTGRTSWNANRLMWCDSDGAPYSGYHYADSSSIHVGSSSKPDHTLSVYGTSFVRGYVKCGALFVGKNGDAAGHNWTGWGTAKPAGNVSAGLGRVYFQVI